MVMTGMGTVWQLTNSSGSLIDTYEYDAFGNVLTPMAPMLNSVAERPLTAATTAWSKM